MVPKINNIVVESFKLVIVCSRLALKSQYSHVTIGIRFCEIETSD